MADPARILVRGPNWLGDLVMSTPGFRALRDRYPHAHITLHVRPGLEPIVAGAPWFDAVLPVRSHHAGAMALLREARALRRHPYDLGICLPDSFSSALLMRAAGVKRVAGFRRGGRGVLLHQPIDPPEAWRASRMVARERFVLDLMKGLGCREQGTHLELFTTPDEERRVDALLRERGAGADEPIVALAPGASFGPSKQWPVERFARVGDVAAQGGARVVLVGSPRETALGRRVCESMTESAVDLTGRLDLGTLKALLRRAKMLVCNDAGARHIAVAFGVHCAVFFGPTSLEKTNYNLENVEVFEGDASCRPCYQRECPIDHRCMTQIDPEDVARSVSAQLSRSGAGSAP